MLKARSVFVSPIKVTKPRSFLAELDEVTLCPRDHRAAVEELMVTATSAKREERGW